MSILASNTASISSGKFENKSNPAITLPDATFASSEIPFDYETCKFAFKFANVLPAVVVPQFVPVEG